MKKLTFSIIIIVLLALALFIFYPKLTKVDSTGKIHTNLYEEAVDVWDAQLTVSRFELVPETQLTVRWTPPEIEYNHFVLSISDANGSLLRKESGEHDRLGLDPDGFEPGETYTFALQACLDPDCTKWLIAKDEASGTTQNIQETEEEQTEEEVKE